MENTLQDYRRTTIFKRPPGFTVHLHLEIYLCFLGCDSVEFEEYRRFSIVTSHKMVIFTVGAVKTLNLTFKLLHIPAQN
jgi:hypothetical protein